MECRSTGAADGYQHRSLVFISLASIDAGGVTDDTEDVAWAEFFEPNQKGSHALGGRTV